MPTPRTPALALALALLAGGWSAAAPAQAAAEAPLVRSTDPGADRLRAVGSLVSAEGSHCTATVVTGPGQVSAEADALVVTSGHCVSGRLGTNEVLVDQEPAEGWSFTPAYFADTVAQHRRVGVRKVRYATMKSLDMAVVQLTVSYADLAAQRIRPFRLDPRAATPGTRVELAHIPVMIDSEERYLRRSLCTGGDRYDLVEHVWYWPRGWVNDCAGVHGGSSGSPVLVAGTDRIAAVLNTTVEPDYSGACYLGRPCELTPTAPRMRTGASYASGLEAVAGCFTADRFDPRAAGCRLPHPRPLELSNRNPYTRSTVTDPEGTVRPARWKLELKATGASHARIKTGPAASTDCAAPDGYGPVFALADRPVFEEPVDRRENLYLACVVAGPGARPGSGWQPYTEATMGLLRVDDTPPTVRPVISVHESDDSYRVDPIFQTWEITGYLVKHGPKAGTDCASSDGYRTYIRIPTTLDKAKGPWRFCAIGLDYADNPTPPAVRDLA